MFLLNTLSSLTVESGIIFGVRCPVCSVRIERIIFDVTFVCVKVLCPKGSRSYWNTSLLILILVISALQMMLYISLSNFFKTGWVGEIRSMSLTVSFRCRMLNLLFLCLLIRRFPIYSFLNTVQGVIFLVKNSHDCFKSNASQYFIKVQHPKT